ncbi:MAG: trehalose-6-phosphate synthase [Candidatus Latescibacteria bacterium]|nr:trehalose-6-phosphate synthase [Candidatus Latescibacterota bacterium]
MNGTHGDGRLVIVSNRLPFVLSKSRTGEWEVKPGSGGLVTALAPVLRNRGGTWIGWPGSSGANAQEIREPLEDASARAGYSLQPVMLSEEEFTNYYQGFSNQIIWPLFHDLQSLCAFRPEFWDAYELVNDRFAEAIGSSIGEEEFIWVHDYHLMSVGKALRDRNIEAKCGFFLHIPFPSPDLFLRLPWRFEILTALLRYDQIGFQTMRDLRNFVQCLRKLVDGVQVEGRGAMVQVHTGERTVRVGAFPISIDFNEFESLARSSEVETRVEELRADEQGRTLILGVDRLDYTKGILQRLDGFRSALEQFPDLQEKITLFQVVVPSRAKIPRYSDLKTEIERKVGEINGRFTRSGWVPIHYLYRRMPRPELVAYYRGADVAMLTPLKDGMNLVAKEYCASHPENDGALILSEFAGAVSQMQKGAFLVNPHDSEGIGRMIHHCCHLDPNEKRLRMKRLRRSVQRRDVYWWVDAFLESAFAKRLEHFPVQEEYLPTHDIRDSVEETRS